MKWFFWKSIDSSIKKTKKPDINTCFRQNTPKKRSLTLNSMESAIPKEKEFPPKLWFQCHFCSGNTTTKKQQNIKEKSKQKRPLYCAMFSHAVFTFPWRKKEKLWSTLKFYIKFFFCWKETNPSFHTPQTHENSRQRIPFPFICEVATTAFSMPRGFDWLQSAFILDFSF